MADLPALSGRQLIRLLLKAGCTQVRRTEHGVGLRYVSGDGRVRLIIVPDKDVALGHTLNDILSVKQSAIGRAGLLEMIEKYGLD